jgi:hypothetical protein
MFTIALGLRQDICCVLMHEMPFYRIVPNILHVKCFEFNDIDINCQRRHIFSPGCYQHSTFVFIS